MKGVLIYLLIALNIHAGSKPEKGANVREIKRIFVKSIESLNEHRASIAISSDKRIEAPQLEGSVRILRDALSIPFSFQECEQVKFQLQNGGTGAGGTFMLFALSNQQHIRAFRERLGREDRVRGDLLATKAPIRYGALLIDDILIVLMINDIGENEVLDRIWARFYALKMRQPKAGENIGNQ